MKNIFLNRTVQTTGNTQMTVDDFNMESALHNTLTWFHEASFNIDDANVSATHAALMENSTEILTEGLKDMKDSIIDFFKRLYQKIKEMTTKLMMYYSAYIGSFEKFIQKYRNRLANTNPNFEVDGYVYSFSPQIPDTSAVDDIISSYNSDVTRVVSMDMDELLTLKEKVENQDYYDRIRGEVIGVGGLISSEEYDDEVFKVYRSGQDNKTSIPVNKSILSAAMSDFKGLKDSQKKVKRDHDQLLLTIAALVRFFERMPITHISDNKKEIYLHQIERSPSKTSLVKKSHDIVETESGINKKLLMYFNLKWKESRELSPIITKAVMGKSIALKENMRLCKDIIRKSIFAKGEDK